MFDVTARALTDAFLVVENASSTWKRFAISLKSLCQRAASTEERRADSLQWTLFLLAKKLSNSSSLASHPTEPAMFSIRNRSSSLANLSESPKIESP